MSTKKIILKEFKSCDKGIIHTIFNSDLRRAIDGQKKNLDKKKLENFISKNKKYLKTVYFDNQRIGVSIKNKSKLKFILRYRYLNKWNYNNIYTAIRDLHI